MARLGTKPSKFLDIKVKHNRIISSGWVRNRRDFRSLQQPRLTTTRPSLNLLAMKENTKELATRLLAGEISEQEFLRSVARLTIASTDQANLDLDRRKRAGYPEVVFGEGKSTDALLGICEQLKAAGEPLLLTRIDRDQAETLRRAHPELAYNAVARTLRSEGNAQRRGRVVVVTAGTSDLPVAEEALETLLWMGVDATRVHDVGVAGPHRLPAHLDQLTDAHAIVVVAGMEGALPSVVAGYLAVPIIAVPTSVGYGANLGGIAALLSMLNSCAANVAVVNIDAGFKAGYVAGMIARVATGTSEA